MKLRVAQICTNMNKVNSHQPRLFSVCPCPMCVCVCVCVWEGVLVGWVRACVKGVGVLIQILPIDRKIDCKTEPEILSREKHCN